MAGSGTWTPMGPSVDVSIVADSATNDLYALGNNASLLLRSGNFGASWSIVPPPPIANCHFAFSVVGGAGIFAAGAFPADGPYEAENCDRSHYKSTDRGASWTLFPPWPFLLVTTSDPTNPSILYGMSVPTSVYKSVDGGATWSLLPTGTPYPFGLWAIAVDANTPSTLYTFGGKSNFLKSTDGGASWITANAGLPGAPDQPNSGIVGDPVSARGIRDERHRPVQERTAQRRGSAFRRLPICPMPRSPSCLATAAIRRAFTPRSRLL